MENPFAPSDEGALDTGECLERLCRSVLLSIPDGIDFSFSDSACQLDAHSCRYLGMIVYELVQDARRRNFPDGHGVIDLELTNHGSATLCRITGNGCDFGRKQAGGCFEKVCALAGLLRATLTCSVGPDGTTWIISIPQRTSKPPIESQRGVPRCTVPTMQRW
jgi:two-component sensor histidine kinase